jgi:hypothetical protein
VKRLAEPVSDLAAGRTRREVGTIYRVGGGVAGAGLPLGIRPVSVGGDAAGGCSRLGLSPIRPF